MVFLISIKILSYIYVDFFTIKSFYLLWIPLNAYLKKKHFMNVGDFLKLYQSFQ